MEIDRDIYGHIGLWSAIQVGKNMDNDMKTTV